MLTLDQPQLQTPDAVAPITSPQTRVASPPAHPSAPPPRDADPPTPAPPTPSPHTPDTLPRQTRAEITDALLAPESDPRDIAQNHNLPLDSILDIFESEDFQHRLQRIERMQERRAEFHLSTTKPLAARNLALILEGALAEELTRTNRDTPEATTVRYRSRETTRKICNTVLARPPRSLEPERPATEASVRGTPPGNEHAHTKENASSPSRKPAPSNAPPTNGVRSLPTDSGGMQDPPRVAGPRSPPKV